MADVESYITVLTTCLYTAILQHSSSAQFSEDKFSRSSSTDTSLNKTLEKLTGIKSQCLCAVKCSQRKTCSAFVYSRSTAVCHLGSGVIFGRDSTYLSDYQLFKSDSDYFQDVDCGSSYFAYTICPLPRANSIKLIFLQQISKSVCQLGVSYGLTDENDLWVDKGCRARFGITVS